MKPTVKLITAFVLCVAISTPILADQVQRQMNVRQGPETVFKQPVAQIVPGLAGAKATSQNGRVGNEFVFWGYRLADGTPAFFYACAAVPGVDCLTRRTQICVSGQTKVLSENQSMGNVQKLSCQPVCDVNAPKAMPCCTGSQQTADLEVGLVSCGG